VVLGGAAPRGFAALAAWRLARRCPVPVLRATARAGRQGGAGVAAPLAGAG
jgi:hypothetical protein